MHNGILCSHKKLETMPPAATSTELETMILSEVSQNEKHKHQNMAQGNLSMKQKQTHRHREQTCRCQGVGGMGRHGLSVQD